MATLTNFAARDVETLLHPATNLATHRTTGPMLLERAEGIHVWDAAGKEYIEGLAGLWCTGLGYGNTELVDAAAEQMRKLSFTHLFGGRSHEPAIQLAEKIKEIAPCPTSKVFFTSSGSEANDSQIKLQWYYNNAIGRPNKKKIISRLRAYHGVTIGSGSLTGIPIFHADFDLPIPGILHTDTPHYWRFARDGESEEEFASRLAGKLEALIEREGPDTIAAFIAEPVMGAGGVILSPKTYFEKVQALLRHYDIAFIADEVICGFARTGNMFGSQTFGMTPDTVSMAKAITSAYMPLGAVTVPEHVYQAMVDESKKLGMFAHGFTYSGHPVASAVAVKTLEIYERIDIVGHVQKVAPTFLKRLKEFDGHPLVGETRGVGLLGGIELVKDKRSRQSFDPRQGVGAKVSVFAQDEGLICRAVGGDTIALCPPLVISTEQVNTMFDRMARALDRGLDWARKEGIVG
ncbi:MAG: aminotransferase class III-fold pyridoxal phosphate-dependent enzyme [Hyphomicrobium sp.]|nr:aminotransferase class III-fold pyridoxal phosphate-dependent enzyme [Hyphomicrobium sp.]MBN9266780.1 aminotransferase class III-fold pyridoxal phosphate-dependent enzyme [Hyphomicrobium sp.]